MCGSDLKSPPHIFFCRNNPSIQVRLTLITDNWSLAMQDKLRRTLLAMFVVVSSLGSISPTVAVPNSIVINEVDCHGNDWIEIGNRSSQTVDISGWLLSDKALNSTAAGHVYTFPSGTSVAAKGRLVVQQSGTGAAHLGFGIACIKGGTIKIGYRLGSSIAEVDSVSIPVVAPQTTYGRIPDLTGAFSQSAATKNSANYGVKPILTSAAVTNCVKGRVCKVTLRAHNTPTFRLIRPLSGVALSSTGVMSVNSVKVATYKPIVIMTNSFGSTQVTITVNVKTR